MIKYECCNIVIFSSTVVMCEVLAEPEDGDLSLDPPGTRAFGTTATYSCVTGHMLVGGDSSRTCQASGVWSGVEPSCQSKCQFEIYTAITLLNHYSCGLWESDHL